MLVVIGTALRSGWVQLAGATMLMWMLAGVVVGEIGGPKE